ncbi:MAG TPA: hypothetical protein VGS08_05315, partial [Candidatus Saccharimonadales bacterium]|nr:hypothetical protein [Candidatus Saccharimonadales bacterium]
ILFDTLRTEIHIPDNGINEQGIADYFGQLGLPVPGIIAFDLQRPPAEFHQRLAHRIFVDDGERLHLGVYSAGLNIAFLALDRFKYWSLDPNRYAAHEVAHASNRRVITYAQAPEGGMYFRTEGVGFQSKPFVEGRAELLGAHCKAFLVKCRTEPWPYYKLPTSFNAPLKLIRVMPGMYGDTSYRLRFFDFSYATDWAINLELLIAKRPSLLDAVLYADQGSEEGINTLQSEFDAIQPGLLERWRTDDSVDLTVSGLAMTRYILDTFYGAEYPDDEGYLDSEAWSHIDHANRFVDQLLRDRLQQTG